MLKIEIRLQKILANAGVASRRKAEELISEGRVTVNGVTVTELGAKAHVRDDVAVDGEAVGRAPRRKTYVMLNKPEGVVTTTADEFGRPTVMDFSPPGKKLFPVGRLDFDTSGLIFLTNDGKWANNLVHPKHEIRKVYIAVLRGVPDEKALQRFREGVKIVDKAAGGRAGRGEGRLTAPAEIDILRGKDKNAKVRITIYEGRNRQVRKMCEAIWHPVISLKRVAIGDVKLGDLQPGRWRYLTEGEILAAGAGE